MCLCNKKEGNREGKREGRKGKEERKEGEGRGKERKKWPLNKAVSSIPKQKVALMNPEEKIHLGMNYNAMLINHQYILNVVQ